jgi:hypothetical protein
MDHTPGKDAASPRGTIFAPNPTKSGGEYVVIADTNAVNYLPLKTRLANAAYIVRTVNAHDALVAVAQSVLDEDQDGLDRTEWRIKAARAALELANRG